MTEKMLRELMEQLTKLMGMLMSVLSKGPEAKADVPEQSRLQRIANFKRYANRMKGQADAELLDEHPLDDARVKLMSQAEDLMPVIDKMTEDLHSESMMQLGYGGFTDAEALQIVKDTQELTESLVYACGALQELWDVASDQLTIPYQKRHKTA